MAKKPKTKTISVKIVPERDVCSKRVYANYVEIRHTDYDFSLVFCDVAPMGNEMQEEIVKSKKIAAPIQVEIVMSPQIVEAMMGALQKNYGNYQERQQHAKKKN